MVADIKRCIQLTRIIFHAVTGADIGTLAYDFRGFIYWFVMLLSQAGLPVRVPGPLPPSPPSMTPHAPLCSAASTAPTAVSTLPLLFCLLLSYPRSCPFPVLPATKITYRVFFVGLGDSRPGYIARSCSAAADVGTCGDHDELKR